MQKGKEIFRFVLCEGEDKMSFWIKLKYTVEFRKLRWTMETNEFRKTCAEKSKCKKVAHTKGRKQNKRAEETRKEKLKKRITMKGKCFGQLELNKRFHSSPWKTRAAFKVKTDQPSGMGTNCELNEENVDELPVSFATITSKSTSLYVTTGRFITDMINWPDPTSYNWFHSSRLEWRFFSEVLVHWTLPADRNVSRTLSERLAF